MGHKSIRNFCIIAHIDHGKSTLADRLLEVTSAVSPRDMVEQFLDNMDLERERGITIKAQAVRLAYKSDSGENYQLNLIDTPGHVDFAYEVSRSLSACEGALLLVDATQGIQAQTVANVYLAVEQGLEIIPIINKIDLDIAEPERVADEVQKTFGFKKEDVIFASAKEGVGVQNILEVIVNKIPSPQGDVDGFLRALIFDSKYDPYKGVVAYVRVFDGAVPKDARIKMMSTGMESEVLEVGTFQPLPTKVEHLMTGEVGYIATGLKRVGDVPVGDTITLSDNPANEPLVPYTPLKPMVFAGIYPADGEDYLALLDALQKLSMNDPALSYQQESSSALGSGFRCGFLGLLHMDVVQERLEREYDLNLLATAPSVSYRVITSGGDVLDIHNPAHFPESQHIEEMQEPWVTVTVITPDKFIGTIIELVTGLRGQYRGMEYIQSALGVGSEVKHQARASLEFSMPLSEMLIGFYDQIKARTQGYASMDYSVEDYKPSNLAKVDILLNGEPVDALSVIVHRDFAQSKGRNLVSRLKDVIPRQMFEVPIQAAIGGRILSRANVKALRKNVLAKCYGGDVTRKRKLLEKQAKGKKRMKKVGRVEIPQEAFLTVLGIDN